MSDKYDWAATYGHGTNAVCAGYVGFDSNPTGCERCGHTLGEHDRRADWREAEAWQEERS